MSRMFTNDEYVNLLSCVFEVCEQFNGSVTSWIRTPARNAKVGGLVTSHHINGGALDVAYDNGPPSEEEVRAVCNKYGIRLVREAAGGAHDHFQV